MALWIASPPTRTRRTPRASLAASDAFDFLAANWKHAESSEDGRRDGDGDRHVVGTERVERGAGEPRADQGAEAGAGIERADDAGRRARTIEVHDDGRHQRHVGAV